MATNWAGYDGSGTRGLAIDNYLRALALDQHNIKAHSNLGLLLVRQWRPTEAIGPFVTILQLDQRTSRPGKIWSKHNDCWRPFKDGRTMTKGGR